MGARGQFEMAGVPASGRRERQTCFVCHGKIAGEPVCIAQPGARDRKREYPDGLFRHQRCAPGTERWVEAVRADLKGMEPREREQARRWLRLFTEGRVA